MTRMMTSPVSVVDIRFVSGLFLLFLAAQKLGSCASVHGVNPTAEVNKTTRRCYCNDASCVATGYMCKSTIGACYARLSLGAGDTVNIRYACADVLPPTSGDARLCTAAVAATLPGDGRNAHTEVVFRTRLATATSAKPEAETAPDWTETTCCATDMCNYYFYRRLSPQGVATPAAGSAVNDTSGFIRQNSVNRDADEVTCFRSHATTTALVVCAVLLLTAVLLTLCVVSALRLVCTHRRHSHRCHDSAVVCVDSVERRALPLTTKTLVGTSNVAVRKCPGSTPGQQCDRCACKGGFSRSNCRCVQSALHLQVPLICDHCNCDYVDVRLFRPDTKFTESPSTVDKVDGSLAVGQRQQNVAGVRSVDLLAGSTHVDWLSELRGVDGPRRDDARAAGIVTASGLPLGVGTGSGVSSSTLDQSLYS